MFAAQIVLLAATAIAPLASNAAPIFSGMFSKPTFARRADSNVQLAQGTNFFFSNLQFETQCTPGQVSCVRGNFATCSQEANWEVTPCLNNTSCFAVPNANNNIDVKCMSETDANNAITQAGGQGGVSVDFQVTEAPFPDASSPTDPNAPTDSSSTEPTPTDSQSGGEATPTDSGSGEPTESCTPEDGSDNGDGSEASGTDGSGSEPTPTGDVAATETSAPTPTDTESCSADEPEETETITLILVPNPTESGAYITETFTGGFPDATDVPSEPTDGNGSDANVPTPTDAPTDGEAAPTETCTETATDGGNNGEGDGQYTYSDAPSDAPSEAPTDAPTDGASDATPTVTTTDRTTYTAPAPTPSDISVVGTHLIPVSPNKRSVKLRRD